MLLSLLAASGALAAPRTDIVTLVNGDRMTGEVKELKRGKLKFKTDTADNVYIQWDKVARVQSQQRLQVELANGDRYIGSAVAGPDTGQMYLSDGTESAAHSLPLIEIVQIHPIDVGKRLALLDGYVTAGYTYTKANDLQEFAFTGGLSSTQDQRKWSIDGSSAVTTQQGSHDTQRYDVTGEYRPFLRDRWFWQAMVNFESNDELGLNLRTGLGAAYGRYLVLSHEHEWATYVGADVTNEREVAAPDRQNVEALVGTEYAFFQYDTPVRTISLHLDVLPSLTDAGRVRAAAKAVSRYEIVRDFFFEVSLYGTYDNKPGANAKSNSDYGADLSLGYSF